MPRNLLLGLALALAAPLCAETVPAQMDAIVSNYRKIIVLTADDAQLDAATRDRVRVTGSMLFEDNESRLRALESQLADYKQLSAFLTRIESDEYRDADKLAFRDLLDDLTTMTSDAATHKRLAEDESALDQIQALYAKELQATIGSLHARGMAVHREAWDKYLAFVGEQYKREDILASSASAQFSVPDPSPDEATRGKAVRKHGEVYGNELPAKTILLTFDDGPHPRYTDQVLAILQKYNIHAVFFEVGQNIGTLNADGTPKLTKAAQASYRILQSGSALGNHSYTHPFLPKLAKDAYTNEIESTNKLLKYIENGDPDVFRPPYGAANDGIMALAESDHLKPMIWNIDSEDWADPVPSSIAQRVLDAVDDQGRGIILFHDIHKRTLDVLPTVIESLQQDGYKFAVWNGSSVVLPEEKPAAPQQTAAAAVASQPAPAAQRGADTSVPDHEDRIRPYRESWAAVIGIDDYKNWPKLRYAANDAQGVRDLLVEKFDFKPDHIFLLTNAEATRENILSLLGDKLGNPDMVKREDRVFVFYAGHGATRRLSSGRELGYIIPADADLTNYQGSAISMTNFQDIAEAIPAKHLLFVMDSCYSGLALTRGGGMGNSKNYLREIARREARQMFTAGGADQQVADNGPNGHSVFTWTLLQGLDGRADLNHDGVITASELAGYVAPAVSALSRQTPAFGNLAGSEGGDFIFELSHSTEMLSADSTQLDEHGIQLNGELEKLRAEVTARSRENEELRKQLAALRSKPQSTAVPEKAAHTAYGFNDDGMRLYKEKKYNEAIAAFQKAAELEPKNALFANNIGFAYYRLQRYDEAVTWLEKSVALDANRAVAYINLGDTYEQLNRKSDARTAYSKFLELMPNGQSAPYVQQKLADLGQ